MSVQSWLNRIWYERAAPPWWLMPLSLTMARWRDRAASYARAAAHRRAWPRPVIVVGN
jgi:tetraacyldisaccharide-1-P 4'-kinase